MTCSSGKLKLYREECHGLQLTKHVTCYKTSLNRKIESCTWLAYRNESHREDKRPQTKEFKQEEVITGENVKNSGVGGWYAKVLGKFSRHLADKDEQQKTSLILKADS